MPDCPCRAVWHSTVKCYLLNYNYCLMVRNKVLSGIFASALRCALVVSCVGSLALHAVGQTAEGEVTPKVQALYAEAQAAERGGDDALAIEKYVAMLKLAPHLAAGYNNLGALYFDRQDYQDAVKVLRKGLQLNPDMPTASAVLGLSYMKMGQNQEAKTPLEAALRANPDDNNVEMALSHALINVRDYDGAVGHLKRYLQRNPKDQQALYMLGKTYLQLSENALGRIQEIDPNSVMAHEVTGEIDESMHNYDGALVEFKKAVELAPKEPGTHFRLGDAYWAISKWDSASTEFQEELKVDPRNCRANWELGSSILQRNGSAEDALGSLNKAVEYCPTLMQARVDRARALIKLNRPAEALPDLEAAEKDNATEPSIHFLLSSVYKSQGNGEASQRELKTYAKLQREASASVAAEADKSLSIKSQAH